MGKPREDDAVSFLIPRGAITVVQRPPTTITQRNCLEVFGLSKEDYLRLAGVAFPVRVIGKLRVARYEDVEAHLSGDRAFLRKYERPKLIRRIKAEETPTMLDYRELARKAGFEKPR
jgi:hypothetical protein